MEPRPVEPRIGLRMLPSPRVVVMRRMAVVASELGILRISAQHWGHIRRRDVRDRGNKRPDGWTNEGDGRYGSSGGSKDRRDNLRAHCVRSYFSR